MKRLILASAAAALVGGLATPGGAAPVPATTCTLFPADNAWHADVRTLPVHPKSATWLTAMGGPTRALHPDFGPAGSGEQPYGIPYQVVGSSQPKVAVDFQYDSESDAGPYPLAADTPIESGSDRHALVVDRDTCTLYELYAVDWNGGQPTAGSGAIWDLRSNALRPQTWTSADAAGLPILAGLLRRDEVVAGEVDHAIRVTAAQTDASYLWPARHEAGAAANPNLPPMGARFRLRADFDLSGFRPDTRVVLTAMQRYGVIVADNGSNWYFTGTSEPGWDPDMLDELKTVRAGSFEAVDVSGLMVDPNSGQVRAAATTTTTAPPTTTSTTPPTTAGPTTTTTAPSTTTSATPPSTIVRSTTTSTTSTVALSPGEAVPVAPTPETGPETGPATGNEPPDEVETAAAGTRSERSRGPIGLIIGLMIGTAIAAGAAGVAAWRRRS